MSVLNCLYESVNNILRKCVEKRAILDGLHIVMLAIDEICDGGLVLKIERNNIFGLKY